MPISHQHKISRAERDTFHMKCQHCHKCFYNIHTEKLSKKIMELHFIQNHPDKICKVEQTTSKAPSLEFGLNSFPKFKSDVVLPEKINTPIVR